MEKKNGEKKEKENEDENEKEEEEIIQNQCRHQQVAWACLKPDKFSL